MKCQLKYLQVTVNVPSILKSIQMYLLIHLQHNLKCETVHWGIGS